ncbi:hypothetical protein [Nocardia vinacea]|uniref:hypothetical protein n=1 Tax=Nocardia vinacea TaxID=96468 RepID=UPI0002F38E47|nr:hypothetical protein [Nocardia vinacea]
MIGSIDSTGPAPVRLLCVAMVYSAAMNTVFRAQVLRARDAPAPTLYLLNGANGGVGGSWYDETDVADLHADRLRGTAIYVSADTGALGPLDTPEGTRGDLIQLVPKICRSVTDRRCSRTGKCHDGHE